MDPKTAATVTNPDLLDAFSQGVGRDLEDSAPEVLIWSVFLYKGNTIKATEYQSTESGLRMLLLDLYQHLSQGNEYGSAQFVGIEKPGVVQQAQNALSEDFAPPS